jgi:hypothetical protein
METNYLVGKTIKAVHIHPLQEIHRAWKSDLTPDICTSMAFLDLANGEFVSIKPCEVALEGERYPALGISLEPSNRNSVQLQKSDGRVVDVVVLHEAEPVLPLEVNRVVESDPLGEGAVSEIRIEGSDSSAIILRHVMPPITLGVIVENGVCVTGRVDAA